jgi:hypothetical protein
MSCAYMHRLFMRFSPTSPVISRVARIKGAIRKWERYEDSINRAIKGVEKRSEPRCPIISDCVRAEGELLHS